MFRHDLLEQFMQMIGVEKENIDNDVEGIEHHLSWNAIDRIGDLVQYFEDNPKRLEELKNVKKISRNDFFSHNILLTYLDSAALNLRCILNS